MSEERKKPGVAFWVTVELVLVLVAYPLSFGPACWLYGMTSQPRGAGKLLYQLYQPLIDHMRYERRTWTAGVLRRWSMLDRGRGVVIIIHYGLGN
jgi:hypothetical protein